MALSDWASDYVNLVLAVGRHDGDFVDAYYGPAAWKTVAEAGEPRPLPALQVEAQRIQAGVAAAEALPGEDVRRDYLLGQLGAVEAHLRRLQGHRFSFDEEAEALYQVRPPHLSVATLEAALGRLSQVLGGTGSVQERYQAARARIIIPTERVDAVFQAAILEARERTRKHASLPTSDHFSVEYDRRVHVVRVHGETV